MQKIILSLYILLFGISLCSAQNTTIAKIKFEEAEEAYNSSNYELALKKLQEAEVNFGKINLPILYLRIVNQDKLITQNPSFLLLQDLQKNCKDFLAKYSTDADAFEKIKDVYNIEEKWKTIKTEGDFESFLKEFKIKQKRDQAFTLAKEIKSDYENSFKTKNSDLGDGKIGFILNFNKHDYLIVKKDDEFIYNKAHLQNIKEIEITKSGIKFYHNDKTELYPEMEFITTFYGESLKDKVLKLIELLETTE